MDGAGARIVARVDKAHRLLGQLHDRHVPGCPDLQGAELWQPIDDLRGVDRRHRDDLIEWKAQTQDLLMTQVT